MLSSEIKQLKVYQEINQFSKLSKLKPYVKQKGSFKLEGGWKLLIFNKLQNIKSLCQKLIIYQN